MIEVLIYIVAAWFFLSLGAGLHSYLVERVYWNRFRDDARKSSIKVFFRWPYTLYRYIRGYDPVH